MTCATLDLTNQTTQDYTFEIKDTNGQTLKVSTSSDKIAQFSHDLLSKLKKEDKEKISLELQNEIIHETGFKEYSSILRGALTGLSFGIALKALTSLEFQSLFTDKFGEQGKTFVRKMGSWIPFMNGTVAPNIASIASAIHTNPYITASVIGISAMATPQAIYDYAQDTVERTLGHLRKGVDVVHQAITDHPIKVIVAAASIFCGYAYCLITDVSAGAIAGAAASNPPA